MKNIILYKPGLEDYWYEQKLQSDPMTMNYNAGYDVSYDGYHCDSGCIDFPSEKWQETFDRRINENKFFAYIKDIDTDQYVGYANYHYSKNDDRYYCGIVIEHKYRGCGYSKISLLKLIETAKKNGVTSLYDNFEISRSNTMKLFLSVGFTVIENLKWNKFNEEVEGVLVKINTSL